MNDATSSDRSAGWLKQHSSSEQSFARALRRYFSDQAARIADAVADFGAIGPDQTAAVFRPDDEHGLLLPVVRRNVGGLMIRGATDELEVLDDLRAPEKTPDGPADDPGELDRLLAEELSGVPETTRLRIRSNLEELAEQDYWRQIQDETEADLVGIIRDSIEAGHTPHTMSVAIRDQLGGFEARRRAMKIARTETTGALNAGHLAMMEELDGSGLLAGKKWLAISDRRLRQTHADLNGSVVAVRGDFSVGGSLAPHPGHWSLPARERINCRCVVTSVVQV